VLQDDPLSPLLFNVLIQDVSAKIKEGAKDLNLYTYADDMAIAADNISDMQEGMDVITK
jgi:Reverse transcriptase (RNA-dependent DNA polymerase).